MQKLLRALHGQSHHTRACSPCVVGGSWAGRLSMFVKLVNPKCI
jgi:hypothetical protein